MDVKMATTAELQSIVDFVTVVARTGEVEPNMWSAAVAASAELAARNV